MFLAVGNDPANQNGASVIQVDQLGNLAFEFELEEQGCFDLLFDGTTLLVPGTDPYESWALGNIYARDNSGIWTKLRTLPNTIHAWGACVHNGAIYVATGGHIGNQSTLKGYVLQSFDDGQTWLSVEVNNYRVWDIISFNGILYTTAQEFSFGDNVYTFYQSQDNGNTWNLVDGIVPDRLPRMAVWQDKLLIIKDSMGLYAIDSIGNIQDILNPPRLITRKFNVMAVDGSDLYVLCEDRVYKTSDLISWEWYCEVPSNSISLMTWPGFGLIVSTSGANAQLLRIPFV